jgi:hypothetical protein
MKNAKNGNDEKSGKGAICSVEGCESFTICRGLCRNHYQTAYRKGELKVYKTKTDQLNEFIDLCLKSTSEDCLEPPFQKNRRYPHAMVNGKLQQIGWIVLEKSAGPRPPGKVAHRSCKNTRCCNPRHLKWASRKKLHAKLSDQQRDYILANYRGRIQGVRRSNAYALAAELGISVGMVDKVVWKARKAEVGNEE